MGTTKVLSRSQIEGLIADGKSIIIVDQMALNVDAWLEYHPGGQKTILHMVGKDATNEISAMHSAKTRSKMRKFQIGRVEMPWQNFVPPIQGGLFRPFLTENEKNQGQVSTSNSPTRPKDLFAAYEVANSSLSKRTVSEIPASSATESQGNREKSFLDLQTQLELDAAYEKYPSLDIYTQDEIVTKYRKLGNDIRAAGLYNCNYTAYAWEFGRCIFLLSIGLLFYTYSWYAVSAIFVGWFWSQLVFSAHDAGHMGITHNYTIDTLIGMIIAAPCGGLSLGWWKATHNVHHIVTNAPEHDPDNQHLPFLAVNHQFLGSLFSTYHERLMAYDAAAKFLVQYQAYLYYPLLTLGRFNLYVQSYTYLLSGQGPRKGSAWWHRYFEILGIILFWHWYGYTLVAHIPTQWQRFLFVMISHMIQMPLHVQLTVSHFAMSTADLGPNESFPQKMLRTTMDIDCPPWLDFFHGGLQFQALHHLFPRIPRHNLRKTQKLVMRFCDEVNIPYSLYSFVEGNVEVVGRLAEVSRQAALLAECQRTIAKRGDLLHDL